MKVGFFLKWTKTHIKQYVQAKEYIDTMIIPVIPFHISQEEKLTASAFQSEIINIFMNELEKELTGRVMLTPSYYYVKEASKEAEVMRLNTWYAEAKKQPFEHIFFLTNDSTWKKSEKDLEGSLLWLPGISSGDIHTKEMHTMIRGQVEQVSELIRSYW